MDESNMCLAVFLLVLFVSDPPRQVAILFDKGE